MHQCSHWGNQGVPMLRSPFLVTLVSFPRPTTQNSASCISSRYQSMAHPQKKTAGAALSQCTAQHEPIYSSIESYLDDGCRHVINITYVHIRLQDRVLRWSDDLQHAYNDVILEPITQESHAEGTSQPHTAQEYVNLRLLHGALHVTKRNGHAQ